MKRSYLLMVLLFGALIGCDESVTNNVTGVAPPSAGSATAQATCGQNGASITIFCKDQSSDPQGLVVAENGVSFDATLSGTAQSFIKLGDIGKTSIIDVTNGGAGTYLVAQNLIGKASGSSIASNEYSVIVTAVSGISAAAVALGYVKADDELAFHASLVVDSYGLAAVADGLISLADAKSMGEVIYSGRLGD